MFSITYLQRPTRIASMFIMLLLLLSSCGDKSEIVEINFARSEDDSEFVQEMIDKFNRENRGQIKVNYVAMARLSDEMYGQIKEDFDSGLNSYDVIAADVVWTPSFASNGWVEDLSADFYDNFKTDDFIRASLNSVIYDYKIWGLPWYTDTGMLYYRKDLLEKSGYNSPPRTWTELTEMAKKVMADSGTKHGLVFQGDDYEGGVTNAVEFVWNAGGNVMIGDLSVDLSFDEAEIDPNIITVNDLEAMQGFSSAYNLIKDGVVNPEVVNMREKECQNAFNAGEAVFMRNWPTAYGLIDADDSQIDISQVGVAPIPSVSEKHPQHSCLGGWNLMISSKISLDRQNASLKFINYLIDARQQKAFAEESGALPTLRSLYEDQNLLKDVPVLALAKDILKLSKSRPVSPYYMEISPMISSSFNSFLKGEQTSYETAESLAANLQEVMVKYR